ncbi:putative histidyl-tRNA synthetase (Histidine--tRNA ligase)(HisRS) [Sulfurihydrogenibium azorense Az-Fu1]|uniref:ATP phosphoribosyltransferase regulatory subunit n=1 Tax=Sulfurihydrogenibium azorense (strain DSM 15241 / OCM 825 / Az-Fu1) TaxID=204536 RepID=C1DTY7_SULAA|nr:putative histidyl-tRNA synthetase (Histidine--tRNA ligase)(HisRS) [Sulfurihydrogenibium azorense Az-Fu1]
MHFKGKKLKIDLPKGVRCFNVEDSFLLDHIEKTIENTFKVWGYDKITLPTIEYYDVHSHIFSPDIRKNLFRIIDRFEGEILILRVDFTTQIARYVASLKDKDFPIRLYYCGDVFRYTVPKGDKLYERKQIGIELIGVSQLEADAEVLAVATSSLKNLGIENFQIDINNIKLFQVLKQLLNLSQNEYQEFLSCIKNREIYKLESFVQHLNIDKKLKSFIISLPTLNGSIDMIKAQADQLKDYPAIYQVLQEFIKIYTILQEYDLHKHVFFDLSEPREFDYYTGMVFEIFIKDFPKPVGYGGRYDRLLSMYNDDYPATGFAFDTLYLFDYLKKLTLDLKPQKDYYIIDTTEDKTLAYQIAKYLREKGFSVARDIVKREVEKSMDFAFKNGFKKVIVITLENSDKKVYIFNNKKEKEELNLEGIFK